MARFIQANQLLCNGCQLCRLACVAAKKKASGLIPSLISVHQGRAGEGIVTVCNHCQEPVCEKACLMEAIYKDQEGLTKRNTEACIGCQSCVAACPLGGAVFDHEETVTLICDLCDGEPLCVAFCPTGALALADVQETSERKRAMAGERLALAGRTGAHIAS